MYGKGHQRKNAANDRVPVKYPWIWTNLPVSPEREEKVSVVSERNSPNHVRQGRSEENRQESTRQRKASVKEFPP